jgi:hypothetical protein
LIANSLLGSDDKKRYKVQNSLIREIDYCIAHYLISKIWTKSLKLKYQLQTEYTTTVDLSQEEGLRSASKKIDVMMKQFEENYAVRDKMF